MIDVIIEARHRIKIKRLSKYSLFLYKGQVWRSLGKLLPDSHSVTAQRIAINQYGSEICLQNSDFCEHTLVEPYKKDIPSIKQGTERYSYSEYFIKQG